MKKCLLIIINVFVFFVLVIAIELTSYFFAGNIKGVTGKENEKDYRIDADSYKNEKEAESYYKHFRRSNNTKWTSYKYWKRKQYKSEVINIDDNGIRKTCNQCTSENHKKIKIFVFGGSTIWGTGVEDCETVPSYISEFLNKRGICAEVYNYGETGYVSFQETISFLLKIRENNCPNIAVFYNGVNDVYSAFQQKFPGIPQNEYRRELEFNNLYTISNNVEQAIEKNGWKAILEIVAKKSNIIRYIRRKLGVPDYKIVDSVVLNNNVVKKDKNIHILKEKTVNMYLNNKEILKKISDSIGVKSLFFLQPAIFFKKNLTDWERQEAEKNWADFNKDVYKGILSQNVDQNDLINLSNIFADTISPIFIDWCHVSAEGNRIVAIEISKKIVELLERDDKNVQNVTGL